MQFATCKQLGTQADDMGTLTQAGYLIGLEKELFAKLGVERRGQWLGRRWRSWGKGGGGGGVRGVREGRRLGRVTCVHDLLSHITVITDENRAWLVPVVRDSESHGGTWWWPAFARTLKG